MRMTVLALFFCVAALYGQQTAVYRASGVMTLNGNTIELKSAVAIWDEVDKAVLIGLFPFAVDEKDARIVADSGAQSLVVLKPSPDASKWKTPPHGAIIVRFQKRAAALRHEDLEGFSLRATGLETPNRSFGVGRRTKQQFAAEVNELSGQLDKTGGTIHLLTAGSESYSGGYFDWNVRVESAILLPAKR
jgi:hypothetical protein